MQLLHATVGRRSFLQTAAGFFLAPWLGGKPNSASPRIQHTRRFVILVQYPVGTPPKEVDRLLSKTATKCLNQTLGKDHPVFHGEPFTVHPNPDSNEKWMFRAEGFETDGYVEYQSPIHDHPWSGPEGEAVIQARAKFLIHGYFYQPRPHLQFPWLSKETALKQIGSYTC